MGIPPRRRVVAGLLAATTCAALSAAPLPARAQPPPGCAGADAVEEFGPTDVSATSGNQSLSVGLNAKGTITVLKWPSPSFYDQVKYRTTDRAEPRFGALPNEGAMLGLAWRRGSGGKWDFEWLRQWPSSQRWTDDDSDAVVTVFSRPAVGLRVTVEDVVAHDEDVLFRHVTVARSRRSIVRAARVIAFANFNPVFTKTAQQPHQDWCSEEDNDDGAAYDGDADAIVHARSGTDESTGAPSGAALAMGFARASNGHQVGADSYAGNAGTSAYDDADDGDLSGEDTATGQVDAAMADQLALTGKRSVSTTLAIAAAFNPEEALGLLQETRGRNPGRVATAKMRWWRSWLSPAPLPKNAPRSVVRMAKRSLIVIRQAADPAPRNGSRGDLIVESITTQPPMGLDWVRHGAYVNAALHAAGHPEMVRAHNVRYAELQATAASRPRGAAATPTGNWAQNYYSDGVVGGPVPYEIDETGLGIWTLWDHFTRTGDRGYLTQTEDIYEAIQRAAQYLTDLCVDPTNGLQCPAPQEGNAAPGQSLVGAQSVWLGLGAAAAAANELGTVESEANAERWSARQTQMGDAIRARFLDDECNCFTNDHAVGGTLLWPVHFVRYGSETADAQAERNFRHVSRAMRGRLETSTYDTRALLGNAYAWGRQRAKLRRVKLGLRWVADVPSTDGTGILGLGWRRFPVENGGIQTILGQPHVPTHAMFYLAALKAFGKRGYSFRG